MNIYIEEKLVQQRQQEMMQAVEQSRLARTAIGQRTTRRVVPRAALGHVFVRVGQQLRALAHAD